MVWCGDLYLSFSLSFSLFVSLSLSLSLSLCFPDVSFLSLSLSRDLSFFIRQYFFLKWPKIAPTWHHNGTKNFPNRAQTGPRAAHMEPKWRQNESKRRKSKKKEPRQQNSGRRAKSSRHFNRKWSLHGPNLGFKMEPRCPRNRSQNRSFSLMPLGIDF